MSKTIKLYFIDKFTEGDTKEQVEAMSKYFEYTTLEDCDFIYCGSIDSMEKAYIALESGKPLIVYCWDYYKWCHEGGHHLDWARYAGLLKLAKIIFVPSRAQQLRLRELLGIKSIVVRSGIKTYEIETRDDRFVLDPLRYYPYEETKWVEKACNELNIPVIHSEHQYTEDKFRDLVASCSFMTCASPEASTGGLTLGEGLWLGKKSLVTDSFFNGAKDYLGIYAEYFNGEDYEDLKRKLLNMWIERPKVDAREYMTKELTFDIMAKELYENTYRYYKRSRKKV